MHNRESQSLGIIFIVLVVAGNFFFFKGISEKGNKESEVQAKVLEVKASDKPDVFNIGDCLRDKEYLTSNNKLGFFLLVIDKTATKYVLCQGQYGSGGAKNVWYGCDINNATENYNTNYVKVMCPKWKIEDEVYGEENEH